MRPRSARPQCHKRTRHGSTRRTIAFAWIQQTRTRPTTGRSALVHCHGWRRQPSGRRTLATAQIRARRRPLETPQAALGHPGTLHSYRTSEARRRARPALGGSRDPHAMSKSAWAAESLTDGAGAGLLCPRYGCVSIGRHCHCSGKRAAPLGEENARRRLSTWSASRVVVSRSVPSSV